MSVGNHDTIAAEVVDATIRVGTTSEVGVVRARRSIYKKDSPR